MERKDTKEYLLGFQKLTLQQKIERIDAIRKVLPMRVPTEMRAFMDELRVEMEYLIAHVHCETFV